MKTEYILECLGGSKVTALEINGNCYFYDKDGKCIIIPIQELKEFVAEINRIQELTEI